MLRKIAFRVEMVLLVISTGLITFQVTSNFFQKNLSESYQVQHFSKEILLENQQKTATFDFDTVQPLSSGAIIREKFTPSELPIIGGVAVPSVAINLPIFKGLSNQVLMRGAGTTKEEQKMGQGNYGLASHHAYEVDLLFTPLLKVKKAELIYLTDLENIYQYQIIHIERVAPEETYWLDEQTDKILVTLITCGDVSGNDRLIVQGQLQQIVPFQQATEEMQIAFNSQ